MHSHQTWDPSAYARHARFVSELATPVVQLLAPRPGERVLDLGCGDGVLTADLARLGCHVLGVDGSGEQVAAARRRGVPAEVMDGEGLTFDAAFDAVFSNAALHWMKRADAVLAGVWRALVPGGRFVGEFGGAGGLTSVRAALAEALSRRGIDAAPLSPWYFPDDTEYRARLAAAGFEVLSIALFPRPTPLPGDLADWLGVFAQSFLAAIPPAERPALVAELCERLRPQLCDATGRWTLDYVRLRFAARKGSLVTGALTSRPDRG